MGGVAAKTDPAALDQQVADLTAETVTGAAASPSTPEPVDAFVLMKSATTFDVAAATTRIAGATVVQTAQSDLRRDAKTAAILAKDPKAPVIALGAPFGDTLAYSLTAVQNKATQIGGGYFATQNRTFVGLHGKIGDAKSGMLGQQGTAASIQIIEEASKKFAANDSRTVVPFFEIVATSASAQPGTDKNSSDEATVEELLPVVDAAEKAGLYVLIDLQPGSASFLEQADEGAVLRGEVDDTAQGEEGQRGHRPRIPWRGRPAPRCAGRGGPTATARPGAARVPRRAAGRTRRPPRAARSRTARRWRRPSP